MLTRLYWCISVALCLEVQPVVSKIDAMVRSPARRVYLAESEPIRRLLLPLGQLSDGVNVGTLPSRSLTLCRDF